MRPRAFLARGLVLVSVAFAACGGGERPDPPATAATATVAPACAALFANLQRVTLALQTGSGLIAQSLDKEQLSERIATQKVQLRRSARLMEAGPVPESLADERRRLVAALRRYASDFGRAQKLAERGDLQGASQAMTDQATVDAILGASQTIEDTCG